MAQKINPMSEQKRESARKPNGEFGSYAAEESGATLDGSADTSATIGSQAADKLQQHLPDGVTVEHNEHPRSEGVEDIRIGEQREDETWPMYIYTNGDGIYDFHAPPPDTPSHNLHDAVDELETDDPEELASFAADFYRNNVAERKPVEPVNPAPKEADTDTLYQLNDELTDELSTKGWVAKDESDYDKLNNLTHEVANSAVVERDDIVQKFLKTEELNELGFDVRHTAYGDSTISRREDNAFVLGGVTGGSVYLRSYNQMHEQESLEGFAETFDKALKSIEVGGASTD